MTSEILDRIHNCSFLEAVILSTWFYNDNLGWDFCLFIYVFLVEIYANLKSNSLIQAEPSELHFSGFELGKDYVKILVRKVLLFSFTTFQKANDVAKSQGRCYVVFVSLFWSYCNRNVLDKCDMWHLIWAGSLILMVVKTLYRYDWEDSAQISSVDNYHSCVRQTIEMVLGQGLWLFLLNFAVSTNQTSVLAPTRDVELLCVLLCSQTQMFYCS